MNLEIEIKNYVITTRIVSLPAEPILSKGKRFELVKKIFLKKIVKFYNKNFDLFAIGFEFTYVSWNKITILFSH